MIIEVAKKRSLPGETVGPYSQESPGPGGSNAFFHYCPIESWRPLVNLYESAECFLVCVDLAGMDRESISVEVRDGVLVIGGNRDHPRPPGGTEDLSIHLMEIDQGPFCRSVEVPSEVDQGRIRASYTNGGFLWVELPKAM